MKYLKIGLILVCMSLLTGLSAQDIITTKAGEEIKAQVLEVLTAEIKYKKHSNPEGPTYSIKKEEVFMIKYKNGEKDVFKITSAKQSDEKVVAKEVGQHLKIEFKSFSTSYYEGTTKIKKHAFLQKLGTNTFAHNQYKLGRDLNLAGNVVGIPAGIVFGYNVGLWIASSSYEPRASVLTVSGLCWAGGIVLNFLGRSKMTGAVNTYNAGGTLGCRLNISENGIGVALKL
jgi:hypothetical protein